MGTPIDFLDHGQAFPTGFDAIWMSQFLDCFSEADIVQIVSDIPSAGDRIVEVAPPLRFEHDNGSEVREATIGDEATTRGR